jgi:hypothetical protein
MLETGELTAAWEEELALVLEDWANEELIFVLEAAEETFAEGELILVLEAEEEALMLEAEETLVLLETLLEETLVLLETLLEETLVLLDTLLEVLDIDEEEDELDTDFLV